MLCYIRTYLFTSLMFPLTNLSNCNPASTCVYVCVNVCVHAVCGCVCIYTYVSVVFVYVMIFFSGN